MQPTFKTTSTTLQPELAEQLHRLASAVARDIEGAAHITVAVVRHNRPWATVFTHPDAEELNAIERSSGGPALDALWSGRIARIPTTLRNADWPEYSLACQRNGVCSVTAFPIAVGDQRLGVLTIMSNHYYGFGVDETRIGIDAARRAAGILRAALDSPDASGLPCRPE